MTRHARTPCSCETEPRLDRDALRAGLRAAVLARWLDQIRAEASIPHRPPAHP